MKNALIATAIAATATIALAGTASACAPGYKSVKIQGNWVCMLDASASNNLSAKPKPTLPGDHSQAGHKRQMNLSDAHKTR